MGSQLLEHNARIVSELQERLADALGDASSDEIADALTLAADDLIGSCIRALREAKTCEAYAEAIKAIMADNKARKDRLERRADKIRAAVAWAMQEAGLPKITAPDLTISSRIGREPLVTTIEPQDAPSEFVRTKVSFSFDNDAIRAALDSGASLDWAHYGNAQPILTVRSK